MKNRQIRAFAGAFLAYSLSGDTDKAIEISKHFTHNEEQEKFFFLTSIILSKFGFEFSDSEPKDLDKINEFFDNLLRQGELKP